MNPQQQQQPSRKQQIESTLADISMQTVAEKMPSIMEDYLGFQILEYDEETAAKASGLLGFSIGNKLCFIPVLFLNGRVRGTDVLYIADTDTCVPANQQTIDYLRDEKNPMIGTPDAGGPEGQSWNAHGLRVFRSPEVGGKIASANGSLLLDFLNEAGADTYREFQKIITSSPEILSNFISVHGKQAMFIEKYRGIGMEKKAAPVEEKEPDITVVTDVLSEHVDKLSPESVEDLMKNPGVAIEDKREPDALSYVVREETSVKLQKPHKPCCAAMLNAFLKPVPVYVDPAPFFPQDPTRSFQGDLILSLEGGYGLLNGRSGSRPAANRDIPFLELPGCSEKADKFVEGGSNGSSMSVNKTYVVINPNTGSVSVPFRVCNKAGDRFRICPDRDLDERDCCIGNDVWISFDKDLDKRPISMAKGTCIYPSSWKVREMKTKASIDINYTGDDTHFYGPCEDSEFPLVPADMSRVHGFSRSTFTKEASFEIYPLTVLKEVYGNGDYKVCWMDKTAAFSTMDGVARELLLEVGLGKGDVMPMLSEVFKGKTVECMVKTAAPFSIPWPEVDTNSGATQYSSTPQVSPAWGFSKTEDSAGQRRGPFDAPITVAEYDQSSRESANELSKVMERAGAGAWDQVFDPGMLGILLSSNTISSKLTEEFIPRVEKSLDSLCRILLSFYWHNSDFQEMYGIENLAEFEDILLSTIKNVGKIVLFVKLKAKGQTQSVDVLSDMNA